MNKFHCPDENNRTQPSPLLGERVASVASRLRGVQRD
jgi:hypothetical protein